MDLVPVEDVKLGDGQLTWRTITDGSIGTAKEEEIVFVLGSSDVDKTQFSFIICCLTEDASNASNPYRPFFLAAKAPPEHLTQHHLISSLPSHFSNSIDVIVSVKSGTNLALSFWETVLRPLLALSREVLRVPATPGQQEDALIDGGEPHVVVTQTAHSVRQYARALAAAPPDDGVEGRGPNAGTRTIILLSGDGGVVDLLNGVSAAEEEENKEGTAGLNSRTGSSPPVVALMPLGTGNALFHSLHKPIASTTTEASPLVLALRTLFRGSPREMPTFRASFSPGSHIVSFGDDPGAVAAAAAAAAAAAENSSAPEKKETPVGHLHGAIVASYGFHASVVYESDTPEYRAHGAKRFGMVAQDLLRESHPYLAHVDIRRSSSDGSASQLERIPRDSHAYVLTALVSNLERTFCISPASQPLDGQLRLVHFAPVGGERTMAAMMAAYDGGKHIGMKWDEDGEEIGYEQVEEVRITVLEEEARWRKVCVDGTIVEVPRGGHMAVTRGRGKAFCVLVDPLAVSA